MTHPGAAPTLEERREPAPVGALSGTLDHRGRILAIEGPVEASLGWNTGELAGVCVARLVAEGDRGRLVELRRALWAMGEISGLCLHGVRSDGGTAVFEVRLALLPHRDPRRGVAGFVAVPATLRDELSFWRAEATRRRMTARLAADAAHEINNPLQALLVHAAVLRHAPDTDAGPVRTETAERLREAAHRIRETSRLVRQLRRRFEGTAQPLRLDPLVTDGLALVAAGARRRGVRFTTRLGGEGVPLKGPSAVLVDAVIAVIDLAAHLADPGTVVDVRTRWRADRRCQRLELFARHDALEGPLDLAATLRSPSRRPPGEGFSAEVVHLLGRLTRRCGAVLEIAGWVGAGTRVALEIPAAFDRRSVGAAGGRA